MLYWLKNLPWRDIFLLLVLLVFEVAMHPLGIGPDRRIHDPAVYRLNDPAYLSGDWYTDMAVESKVYTFYAALVNVGPSMGIPEELWRQTLYVVCLLILYWSLWKITRLFTRNRWVLPIIVFFHALIVLVAPPTWLYGLFMHIDGGLAPRSIGIAFSFLALFLLLKGKRLWPWFFLGLATLVHVSNSLIVFVLFFGSKIILIGWESFRERIIPWRTLFLAALQSTLVYLLSGGWFALYVAAQGSFESATFSPEKFIWTWIYFRAPYMALPLIDWRMWLFFAFHISVFMFGWYWLRNRTDEERKKAYDLLGIVSLGSLALFGFFYLVTFMAPWLPGFQFYSLRVIYFSYFSAYFFGAMLLVSWIKIGMEQYAVPPKKIWLIGWGVVFVLTLSSPGSYCIERSYRNLGHTWARLQDLGNPIGPPPEDEVVGRYLFLHPEPFLGPPDWYGSVAYLPHGTSFKTFGFTTKGLEEWYERMNAVSNGELERAYQEQIKTGVFQPVVFQWGRVYSQLTAAEVSRLSKQYHLKLFVSYRENEYDFPVLAEDTRYRLYRIQR